MVSPYRISVAQYQAMGEAGILHQRDRIELIRGFLVGKMVVGDEHVACVNRLMRLLLLRADPHAEPSIQNPMVLADSEPEPDVALVRLINGSPAHMKPLANDVLLVIEVADSSLDYDRKTKVPLYAENGIPEVWLVDVAGQAVEVYRRPQGLAYQDFQRETRGFSITLLELPSVVIRVDEIFQR